MGRWTLVFLLVALFAAVIGFTGVAADAAPVAQLLFVGFLVLFVATAAGRSGRRPL